MKKLVLVLVAALTLAFPACQTAAKTPLKIGVIPMMTVLPLYVADEDGLFKKQDLDVEIVTFRSVVERDTALNAGQIDGIIEDIFSAPLLNKEQPAVKVVAVSPVDGPMFFIVGAAQSKANRVSDLKGAGLALSLNTITEYAADRIAINAGLTSGDIEKISVPSMPLRLEMLNAGKVDAALLSRPLADQAVLQGAKVIGSDSLSRASDSSIMFSSQSLKSRPGDVSKFLRAWSAAVDSIDANAQKYRPLLVKVAGVPDQLAASIDVPRFVKPRLPTAEELQPKVDWLTEKGILNRKIMFEHVVASGYLP